MNKKFQFITKREFFFDKTERNNTIYDSIKVVNESSSRFFIRFFFHSTNRLIELEILTVTFCDAIFDACIIFNSNKTNKTRYCFSISCYLQQHVLFWSIMSNVPNIRNIFKIPLKNPHIVKQHFRRFFCNFNLEIFFSLKQVFSPKKN